MSRWEFHWVELNSYVAIWARCGGDGENAADPGGMVGLVNTHGPEVAGCGMGSGHGSRSRMRWKRWWFRLLRVPQREAVVSDSAALSELCNDDDDVFVPWMVVLFKRRSSRVVGGDTTFALRSRGDER